MRMVLRCFSILVLCQATTLWAGHWPQFRGPSGQGHAEATGLPAKLSETDNLVWKVEVPGRGWSSPVVWGDQVWMTTAIEEKPTPEEREKLLEGVDQAGQREVVNKITLRALAFNVKTGKSWHDIHLFDVIKPQPIHTLNSFSSPTPVIEKGRVYCHFGAFGTAAIDTQSGEILWRRELVIHHEVGPGSSPVIYKDMVVIVSDGYDKQFVTALDKDTGDTRWTTDRPPIRQENGSLKKAFCTPLVVEVGGRDQMIIPGAQWFIAYDPVNGKELWRVDHGDGFSNVPRPVVGHGLAYLMTGFTTPELWAVRLDGQGDLDESHVAWKVKKQMPKKSSPLLLGDELYIISDIGILSCLDAKTGEEIYRERMPGDYSASLLYADDKIYLFSHDGDITAIAPGREFKQLAQTQIDGQIMATPAVADNAIFLRSDTHLYRFEIK